MSGTDLRELTAVACAALGIVADDLESFNDESAHVEWPPEISRKLTEHAGLVAAMKWAKERMTTEQAELVKGVYRKALPLDVGDMPIPPPLPETLEACRQALEIIRRARLLDAELDDEIHRQERQP